jgi:hypothetical protein
MTKQTFDKDEWNACKNRVAHAVRQMIDEGYPEAMVADVTTAVGVFLVDRVYGRDALVAHLTNLAMKTSDPNFDLAGGGL